MATAYPAYGTCLQQEIASVFTDIAQVRSITGPSIAKASIDSTHLKSPNGWRENVAGLKDGGEVTFELLFDPAETSHQEILDLLDEDQATNFKIIWSDDASTEWPFAATLQSASPTAELDGLLLMSVTLKVSGEITFP